MRVASVLLTVGDSSVFYFGGDAEELTIPRPPALLTALASSAYPTHCIPPWTTGTARHQLECSLTDSWQATSYPERPRESSIERHVGCSRED